MHRHGFDFLNKSVGQTTKFCIGVSLIMIISCLFESYYHSIDVKICLNYIFDIEGGYNIT